MWLLSYCAKNKLATCDRIVIFWHFEINEWITRLLRGTCLTGNYLSPAFMWVHKEEIPQSAHKIQLQILTQNLSAGLAQKDESAAALLCFFPQSPCSVSLCSFVLLSFLYLWIRPLFHSSTFNQFFFDTRVPYQPPKPGHSKCFPASLLFLLSFHLIFFTWASTSSLSPVNHYSHLCRVIHSVCLFLCLYFNTSNWLLDVVSCFCSTPNRITDIDVALHAPQCKGCMEVCGRT